MLLPYKLIKTDANTYLFHTKNGIEYNCQFYEVDESKSYFNSLELRSVTFNFNLIRVTNVERTFYDPQVSVTVAYLLNLFFDQNPDSIITYICDNIDNRGLKRDVSFSQWVKKFNKEPKKTLIRASIIDELFIGVLLTENHPEKRMIKDFMNSQLNEIKQEFVKDFLLEIIN